jgi:glycerol kinase
MGGAGARAMGVLAIDEGTTGVTALVLDERRRVVGRAYAEVACLYPRPGWVEQDAEAVAKATKSVARKAAREAARKGVRVEAVGIANQRETTIVWDRRTGQPVGPAIVWQDRRTAARCQQLRGDWAGTVQERTGLVVDPYFCASKLEWILSKPAIRRRAEAGRLAFGTIDSWLAWNLTGAHVTDPTNASRTMLWDIRRGEWDAELLELFGVPESILPEVVPSSHAFGVTGAFGGAVPVASLVGDQQAALFGSRAFSPGQAKNTYGTGCFLLQHTGTEAVQSRNGLLCTRAASPDATPRFALEGSVFSAGSAIQWLRDELGILAKSSDVDRLAARVPDAGGVHFVPAFTGLGAPYWDPDARGAILGITRGTDKRHIARAVLEAIALQSMELLEAMEKDAGRVKELRVDGGATRSRILLQIQADLLQRPVVRPANIETTAMGAGLLAGLAVDAWGMKDLKAEKGDKRFEPCIKPKEAQKRLAAWRRAVQATRAYLP